MRKIAIPVILAVAIVLVTVWLAAQPKASKPAVVPEVIRVANIGIYSNYNIIADRLGFFRENGLDAEVDEYDSGATSMDALASGKADVAVAASFVGVRRILTDNDVRILATVSRHDVFRIIARADKGIAKPFDLKGKKIGATLKTAGEFYLGKFLTSNGLKREDMTVINLSATDIITKIEDGSIDAAVIFDPNAYRVERALAGNGIVWSAQGNRREMAIVYTTRQFIDAHPKVVERYMRALVEAERWQASHEKEARQLLSKALSYDAGYTDHLWSNFDFAIRLDQELLVTMEDQTRWIVANGLVGDVRTPDYLGYIFFDALEKADPSAVTIVH